MARKPLFRSTVVPYHVFNRVNNKEWFPLPMEEVWDLFARECYGISLVCGVRIHAFTLMSNHFHMILTTPELDLGEAMCAFAGSVARTVNLKTGRSGHLFTGRYRWSSLQSPIYFAHALKYVYRNPVRAGMVDRVEDYPYSSLFGLTGGDHLPFPVFDPTDHYSGINFVPREFDDFLSWLNRPFKKEHYESIRKALRRKVFELPREGWKRGPSELDSGLA